MHINHYNLKSSPVYWILVIEQDLFTLYYPTTGIIKYIIFN